MENIQQFFLSINSSSLLYESLIISSVTIVSVFLFKFIIEKFIFRFKSNNSFWMESICSSAKLPIIWFCLLFGGVYLVDSFDNNLRLHLLDDFSVFRKLVSILTISWFAFNLIEIVEENYLLKRNKNSKLDSGTADALTKTARITVTVLVCLLTMQTLDFNISALVAFAGGGGIVAGFAAKDILSNFFGALSIYLDKPFVVGDWIKSPDKDIEGIVEKIGLRVTKIRTLERQVLYIQNSIFNTLSIENVTKMSHRRFKEKIDLQYKSFKNIDLVTKKIEDVIRGHDGVDSKMIVAINIISFDKEQVTLMIMAFTKIKGFEEFNRFKQSLLLNIVQSVEDEGGKVNQLYQPSKLAAEFK